MNNSNFLYGGQMSDINNPEEVEGGKGIKLHSWNFGGTLQNPPNKTMPDPSGAKEPNGDNKSFLKALDEE